MPDFDFDSQTTRYRPQNAYWLSRIAELAYREVSDDDPAPDPTAIRRELDAWDGGFDELHTFNKNSSQAFVTRNDEIVVASFRGTDELEDWFDNLRVTSVPTTMGRVHRGFKLALDDVWAEMREAIDDLRGGSRVLFITGHSLGGAMAALAGGSLVEEDLPFYGVYTYGQPRCCDREYARNYNVEASRRIFRFQNNNDIVTRVPQRLAGYSHIGTYVYIDTDKELSTDSHFWFRFLDTMKGAAEDLLKLGIDAVNDHDIERYVAALDVNRDRVPEGL